MERALAIARRNHWPGSIGATLARTAACMRKLGRLDAAHEMLSEALQVMQPLQGSRNHTSAVLWMADLQIELEEYENALTNYRALQELAQRQGQRDMQIYARQGLVNALSKLQQVLPALEIAQEALRMGEQQNNILSQVTSLQLLASLYDKHGAQVALPMPVELQAAAENPQTPQLYYLERAYRLAETIEGNSISSILLNDIAHAYAKAGNFAAAYAFSQKTIASHSKLHHTAITNRATAIEMQHKAERARLESEHLRQLAQEQAQRAQLLQDANATRGVDAIDGPLRVEGLALQHHPDMALMLCDSEGQSMTSIFRQEGERLLPTLQISIDDHHSYSAQCVRERREIEMMKARGEYNPAQTSDASPTLSALFGPLIIGQRILGVITIQSEQEYVYGERERLIFRSLCAYGAIALANAHAYQQLQEAQQQLVAQEKLAALGSLVAGVAHELNTPLGNSLVAITGMQDQLQQLAQQLQDQSLRISDLQNFILDGQELATLAMRNMRAAANLVSNFKQIATNRHQQELHDFNLLHVTQDICATMAGQMQGAGHRVEIDIPENIMLYSFPSAYSQVLTGLLNNALTHAFFEREHGRITISAKLHKTQRVQICVTDNGQGIAEEHLKLIFDPFFTTRLGQGGNGLGLSICYNIVTSLLRGQIQVFSTVGNGTMFTLDLPLRADT
ncbi:MAG: GAF domain-containing sensor histidine kinase, partial [Burkholderiales bacterium]|nr:GAF domain-containing sensor histidine kinase [Burkholderiales bacterium]